MFYTAALSKHNPESPPKKSPVRFLFSSTPDLPLDIEEEEQLINVIRKRCTNEKRAHARHPLYHYNPRCDHHAHHKDNCEIGQFKQISKKPDKLIKPNKLSDNVEYKTNTTIIQYDNREQSKFIINQLSLPLINVKPVVPSHTNHNLTINNKSLYTKRHMWYFRNHSDISNYFHSFKNSNLHFAGLTNIIKCVSLPVLHNSECQNIDNDGNGDNDIGDNNNKNNRKECRMSNCINPKNKSSAAKLGQFNNELVIRRTRRDQMRSGDETDYGRVISERKTTTTPKAESITSSVSAMVPDTSINKVLLEKFTSSPERQIDKLKNKLIDFQSMGNMINTNIQKYRTQDSTLISDQTDNINQYCSSPKRNLKFTVPEFFMPFVDLDKRRFTQVIVNDDQNKDNSDLLPKNEHNDLCTNRRNTLTDRLKRFQASFEKPFGKTTTKSQSKLAKHSESANANSSKLILDLSEEKSSDNSQTTISSSSCDKCRRIILNVSGLRFETWLAVLERHPSTLLGNELKRKPYYDELRKEYFFDRHRPSFEAIFNYYQYGGRLKRPAIVPDDVFLSECEFFEVESEALDLYKKNEGYIPDILILPKGNIKRKLWMLFEYPETSLLALIFSILSFVFTVMSIVLFCVETLPVYAQTHCEPGAKPNFRDPFFIIESVCTFWFTLEIFIRFFSCPSQKAFLKDIKNLIDLAAIVPYYITLVNVLISFSCEGAKNSASLAFLRVIRLIRVFKLTKHSSGLQVLVLTFKESVEGLSLFLVAFIVCILVFSSTIYYVEVDTKGSQIESIPDAFWWAVITMCTVGYGDKVPKGTLGKIVGSVCAVAGVLTLAIPVPIITENFNKFYAHKTGRGRR